MILIIIAIFFLSTEILTLLSGILLILKAPKLLPSKQWKNKNEHRPLVSVLVPAHNEAKHLKSSLQTLITQDYPNLEVLIINDRSQDETQKIIDDFCQHYKFCHGITINDLPEGWLGKSHALQQGLNQAKGEYCLLTDADVIHAPWVISATVAMCKKKRLDYCTLAPNITPKTNTLSWFMPFLGYVLYLTLHPWRMNTRICYKPTGIGAFNFFKTTLLRETKALNVVALDPIDDVGVAKAIGQKSQKGAFLLSENAITLDWYPDLNALKKGLEKNLYRQFNYQKPRFFISLIGLLGYIFSPVIFLILGSSTLIKIEVVMLIIRYCFFLMQPNNSWSRKTIAYIMHPLSALVFSYIAIRSVFLAEKRQAILWGGISFPLSKLKAFLKKNTNS